VVVAFGRPRLREAERKEHTKIQGVTGCVRTVFMSWFRPRMRRVGRARGALEFYENPRSGMLPFGDGWLRGSGDENASQERLVAQTWGTLGFAKTRRLFVCGAVGKCFGYLVDPASGICLSQGLSHASVSISNFTTKLRMAR
jgi:hypothetical protein